MQADTRARTAAMENYGALCVFEAVRFPRAQEEGHVMFPQSAARFQLTVNSNKLSQIGQATVRKKFCIFRMEDGG